MRQLFVDYAGEALPAGNAEVQVSGGPLFGRNFAMLAPLGMVVSYEPAGWNM